MKRYLAPITFFLLLALHLHAEVVERDGYLFSASKSDLEAVVIREDKLAANSKARYELSALSTVDEYDRTNTLLIASLENISQLSITGLYGGLGFNYQQAYLDDRAGTVLSTLALKGRIIYTLPFQARLTGLISHAPDPLCLSDQVQSYTQARAFAEMPVAKQGSVLAGYRTIRYTYHNRAYSFNETAYVGVRLTF